MRQLLNRTLSHVFSYLLQALIHSISLHAAAVTAITVRVAVLIVIVLQAYPSCLGIALPTQVYLRLLPVVNQSRWRRRLVVLVGGRIVSRTTATHNIGCTAATVVQVAVALAERITQRLLHFVAGLCCVGRRHIDVGRGGGSILVHDQGGIVL